MTRLNILHHGSCFDGCASSALFRAFYLRHVDPEAVVHTTPLVHGPPGELPASLLAGDDNAIVDYGYSRDPRLGWWFDHHRSGLKEPDRAHFEARPAERFFYDPKAPSCTGFMARVLAERYGFDVAPLAELVHWAEIIDAAAFTDPTQAVELEEPALRLMTVLEASTDEELQRRIIAGMGASPLAEVVADPVVDAALQPLLLRHRENIGIVRERIRRVGPVVTYDVCDLGLEGINKFIPYYLHPDATYAVAVTAGPRRAKIGVGSNPWRPGERRHDIAALCQRFGGGGHPVVGAISLPPEDVEGARSVAAQVIEALAGPGDAPAP